MRYLAVVLFFLATLGVQAQGLFVPVDPSQFVTQSQRTTDQATAQSAANAAQAAAIAASATPMLSTPPVTGPGAGVCSDYWVPSNTTSPAGPSGTCSKIHMCGTSSTYTIVTTNVGNGC